MLTALGTVRTMYPADTPSKVAYDSTVSSSFMWQVRDDREGDWYIAWEGTLWECIALNDEYHKEPEHLF
jgi:hypothetical protein